MFRDIAGAQPRQLFASLADLARGLAATPTWTPAETVALREGIENLLLSYEAAVGRHVFNLPSAALDRVESIWVHLDAAAEQLLALTQVASDLITATWAGEDRTSLREKRDLLVEGTLRHVRGAVAEWEWLVGAADS